ncbi:MAG: SH3 domain-containing protein [Devosia sp.]
MFKTTLRTAVLALAMAASTVTGSMAVEYGWTTAGVNFRSGPSTYYEVIGQIAPCVKVTIDYKENNWYKVSWNDREGWVAVKYVSYDKPYCGSYEEPAKGNTYKPAPKY